MIIDLGSEGVKKGLDPDPQHCVMYVMKIGLTSSIKQ
jgi:hypothetical protein